MIIILVDDITPRITYTFDFIFKVRSVDYALTTDINEFENSNFIKLNYSNQESSGYNVYPASLLYDSDIVNYSISKSTYNDVDCLKIDNVSDPVATVFYLLSRYEEYTCSATDQFGRFPFEQSCLSRFNWVESAIADRCSLEIMNSIGVLGARGRVNLIPTFDIDNTFAYKLKVGKRAFFALGKDLLKLNFRRLKERKEVRKGGRDPYDTYALIKNVSRKFILTQVFWLVGDLGKKDRNISIDIDEHQKLIKSIGDYVEVNLHPSFGSFNNADVIKTEKKNLESVLEKNITSSRQHFLRFSLPKTYQVLSKCGFKDDYSMGFAERAGFRSGTARPHLWFDLSINTTSSMVVHPFVYMDGTLNEYMGLSIEKSKDKIEELYQEVIECGGDFIFIWHNETIGDYGKWKGWSEVLNFTLALGNE